MGAGSNTSQSSRLTTDERERVELLLLRGLLGREEPITVAEALGRDSPALRPAAESLLQELESRGFLRVYPPSGRQRAPRCELTDEGRKAAQQRLAGTKPAPTGAAGSRKGPRAVLERRVEALEARLAEWVARMEAIERRIAAVEQALQPPHTAAELAAAPPAAPGAPPARSSVAGLDAFRRWLFAALDELDRRNRRLGLVPIPRVREALKDRVGQQEFDHLVLRLAAQREIVLVAHDRPAALSPADLDGSLRDPVSGQLYHWIRWGM